MKDIQIILEKLISEINEGKSEEEIFQFLKSSFSKDLEKDKKLIENLIKIDNAKIAQLLIRLISLTSDKNLRKIIKRYIYKLRTKGISVEKVPFEEKSGFRPEPTESTKAFISNYDFSWNRILILSIPYFGKPKIYLIGILNDIKGLIEFGGRNFSKKGFTEFFENIQKGSPTPMVEIDPPYAAFLFLEAYQLSIRNGNPLKSFSQFKDEIEKIKKDYNKPLVYYYLNADEIGKNTYLLAKERELLEKEIFKDWYLDDDLIQPYVKEVIDAKESRIVLNKMQREERLLGIYERALLEIFSDDKRFIFKRRLEETAYFLIKLGREEDAKIALAIAIELEKPLNRFQPNHFLLRLIIRSVEERLEEVYEKRSKQLILKP